MGYQDGVYRPSPLGRYRFYGGSGTGRAISDPPMARAADPGLVDPWRNIPISRGERCRVKPCDHRQIVHQADDTVAGFNRRPCLTSSPEFANHDPSPIVSWLESWQAIPINWSIGF